MQDDNKPKQHKTLNQRLKNKRLKLKNHKKQKKQKHEAYDPMKAKKKFFEGKEGNKDKDEQGVKVYKLKKYLIRFTKVFEDDLEDFYAIWSNLDEGAEIDMEDIENQKIRKVLKSICKCLGLRKVGKGGYVKAEQTKMKLGVYVKQKMEEVIQNYLQNGTQSQQVSEEEQVQGKKEGNVKINATKHGSVIIQQLPKQIGPLMTKVVGPSLPPTNYNQGQSILNQALSQTNKPTSQDLKNQQQDQIGDIFRRIISHKNTTPITPSGNDSICAIGSAPLQEQQINQQKASQFIQQYNKEYRSKSLMQIHQQKLKQGQVSQQQQKTQRVPFSREQIMRPDRVDIGKFKAVIQEGGFFNFNEKMAKPTNQNKRHL